VSDVRPIVNVPSANDGFIEGVEPNADPLLLVTSEKKSIPDILITPELDDEDDEDGEDGDGEDDELVDSGVNITAYDITGLLIQLNLILNCKYTVSVVKILPGITSVICIANCCNIHGIGVDGVIIFDVLPGKFIIYNL